jgi:hypothetical protein
MTGRSPVRSCAPTPIAVGWHVNAWQRPRHPRRTPARTVSKHNGEVIAGHFVFEYGEFVERLHIPHEVWEGAIEPEAWLQITQKENPDYDYWGCLLDCRSYGGFSGSPCFGEELLPILNREDEPILPVEEVAPGDEPPRFGPLLSVNPLIGIFVAHYTDEGDETNPENAVSRYGVGVMVPMTYIWEALMTDVVKNYVQRMDDAVANEQAAGHLEPRDARAKTEPRRPV